MKNLILATLCLTTLTAQAANWQRFLTCDNNGVHLDFNVDSKQQLQLVIDNHNAIDYLCRRLQTSPLYYAGNAGFQGQQENQGEFHSGVSRRHYNLGNFLRTNDGVVKSYDEAVYFYREAQGLKVEVIRYNLEYCLGYHGRYGTCTQGTRMVNEQYVGNWFFPNCQ